MLGYLHIMPLAKVTHTAPVQWVHAASEYYRLYTSIVCHVQKNITRRGMLWLYALCGVLLCACNSAYWNTYRSVVG